jgi:hypothetical protein
MVEHNKNIYISEKNVLERPGNYRTLAEEDQNLQD